MAYLGTTSAMDTTAPALPNPVMANQAERQNTARATSLHVRNPTGIRNARAPNASAVGGEKNNGEVNRRLNP